MSTTGSSRHRSSRWGATTNVWRPVGSEAEGHRFGTGPEERPKEQDMPRFLIEREIPGASTLTEAQLAEIAQTSNAAVDSLGVPYNWVTSYVAGDKIYCLHEADDAETILERERELDVLSGALAAAIGGAGSGIAITGESGAGKSVLVEAACARAASTRLRVLRGGCDPLVTPRPLGSFRDLLADLGPLDGHVPLTEVCESTYAVLRSEPTVLVVEDLHWIDAASVEVLRFLVRRIEAMPCAIVVTYRDDEIGDQHSARPLLGDFAVLEHLETRRLSPLSVEGVAAMLQDGRLDPEKVHAVTGGNAFFVTEVAKQPDLALPSTVRDAVLARTAGIAPADFEVLQLAASAPDRLDDRVLPAD